MTGVVIATRIAWVQATTVLGHTVDRVLKKPTRHVGFRQRCVTSWAGFRGAVSLAAALAVPMTTNSGAPFPDRNLIIFVVSVVILVTVLVKDFLAHRRSVGEDARRRRARQRIAAGPHP